MIIEVKYSNTNTYLISGTQGYVLFDTGWAGTFQEFCKAIKKVKVDISEIQYIFISHFHPDHMGIAQSIADHGSKVVVFDVQREYIHYADAIFQKEAKYDYVPIRDEEVLLVSLQEGKELLAKLGIAGEVMYTPGHSDDSISIVLGSGEILVGDLNPLYELEMHRGTDIQKSWEALLAGNPKRIYYGHAKMTQLGSEEKQEEPDTHELFSLVRKILHYIDRGKNKQTICKKTGADEEFVEDVMRMYLTHQNVGVQGILDRIEIKGK